MSNKKKAISRVSVEEFIQKLFDETLSDEDQFDPEIVNLVRRHLGQGRIQSKASNNLADDLILLAKARSQEEEK
jgi:hypothetical protein